jgi:hypothetical protein
MEIDISRYRKIVALVVTGAVVYGLKLAGLGVADLGQFGLSLGAVSEPIVDFLVSVGLPAVAALAQPNEQGDSLWRHWRWLAGGTAAIGVLIVLAIAAGRVLA